MFLSEIINAVEPGGILKLSPGEITLDEDLTISKNMTLAGSTSSEKTILVLSKKGTIYSKASSLQLQDIVFVKGKSRNGNILNVMTGDVKVKNCRFESKCSGISVKSPDSFLTLESCSIKAITGVDVSNFAKAEINDCELVNDFFCFSVFDNGQIKIKNTTMKKADYGVFGKNNATMDIENCVISEMCVAGIGLSETQKVTVSNTLIEKCDYGLQALKGSHLILKDCQIRDNIYDGIFISRNASVKASGCDIINNLFDGIRID